MNNKTQKTAIVPSAAGTAESIPEPIARLVEKSFAENTMRNRKQALRAFSYWLRGERSQTGYSLNMQHTSLTQAKHLGQSPLWSPR